MMKKFFSLSLVLGLGLVAFANAEEAAVAPEVAATPVAEVVKEVAPVVAEVAAPVVVEAPKPVEVVAPVAPAAPVVSATPAVTATTPVVNAATSKKECRFGKVCGKVRGACGKGYDYVGKGCKAFAALPVSYKVLSGLGLSAAACLVLYNTNEAFRNFIAGSDDEAAN